MTKENTTSGKVSTKISLAEYKKRFSALRQYVNFSWDGRNKLTPARKSAVTRAWRKSSYAVTATKATHGGTYAFVKIKPHTKAAKSAHAVFHPSAVTGKGVFLRVPGVRGIDNASVSVDKLGNVQLIIGRQRITYVPIDRARLAKSPEKVKNEVLKMYPFARYMTFGIFGRSALQIWSTDLDLDATMIYEYRGDVIKKKLKAASRMARKNMKQTGLWKDKLVDESPATCFILYSSVKKKTSNKAK